jgi:hypothetical protein
VRCGKGLRDIEVPMQRFLAGLCLLILTPTLCLAWGPRGHRAVAEIAQIYLTERAAVEIQELLGGAANSLVEISYWADNILDDFPETFFWHTVDIPHDGGTYDRERDCFSDDCVVEKIKEFAANLANRQLSNLLRSDALKFLVHFVADLHVPLHAYAPGTADDVWGIWEGWEGPWLRIGGRVDQLHNWWDYGFVYALRPFVPIAPSATELARELAAQITDDQYAAWIESTPEAWANESFRIAREFVDKHGLIDPERLRGNSHEAPLVLPASTIDEVKPIVAERLKMAGVRLAWLLNQILK